MKGNLTVVVASASLGMMLAATAASGDEKDEKSKQDRNESERTCVQLSRVRSTTVIDDHSILFELRDGNLFLNYLPQTCPNLGREKRFAYRVTANRLCDVDTITVLEDFGLGLSPGATCKLGTFNSITKEAAEDLKAGPHKSRIEVEQVNPVKTDDEAASAAAEDDSGGSGATGNSADGKDPAASSAADDADATSKAKEGRKGKHRRSQKE